MNKSKLLYFKIITVVIVVFFAFLITKFLFAERNVTANIKSVLPEKHPKNVSKTLFSAKLSKFWSKYQITSSISDLNKAFATFNEITGKPLVLSTKKKKFSTKHLNLKLYITEKSYNIKNEDRFSVNLSIFNKTKKFLAFRISFQKSGLLIPCHNLKLIKTNVFLLKPQTKNIYQLSCSPTKKLSVILDKLQVVELPEAAYLNLNRIINPPGLAPEIIKLHKRDKSTLPECIIKDLFILNNKIKKNPSFWFSTIDFFAKHDCATENM